RTIPADQPSLAATPRIGRRKNRQCGQRGTYAGEGDRLVGLAAPHGGDAEWLCRLLRHQAHEHLARKGAGPSPGGVLGHDLIAPPRGRRVERLALLARAAAVVHEAVHGFERTGSANAAVLLHGSRAPHRQWALLCSVP